jgi:hypothetical protein
VFCEGSHVNSDWKEGSKILFLDGKGNGMVSLVNQHRPSEYMSFKHIGILKDGVEDTDSEEVQKFAGAQENYTLTTVENGKTKLAIDVDTDDKYKDFFEGVWPKALQKVKEMAEA